MIVIGLTGGIGTGKSEVARILQELGAVIINADQVGHQAYTPHTEAWSEVVKAFGAEILREDGEIDRRKLGGIVFADPAQLTRLNQIMHPRMARMVAEQIEELQGQGIPAIVVEAAVLFEAGWESLVEEVWTTESPVAAVAARLQARSGWDADEVQKRVDSQMSSAERSERADVVVENSGDLESLERRIKSLWESRVEGRIEQA
ncbi:MAG: dephospho-CoA kinase [Dehalococcoidia bacterium]